MSIASVGEALSRGTVAAMRADADALDTALAMAWTCLGDEWHTLVRLERHTTGRGLPEARVVLDDRVIHRQWWEQEGEYALVLRQEWCP